MKTIEKQQENIKNLLKLISENPDLEILPMVDSECVQSDDYSSWMSAWGNARVDYYYCSDERIYFKYHDFEELVEKFIDDNCEEDFADEEFEKIAESKVEAYEWVKAIIVNINPN